MCIGRDFAYVEGMTVLANLLRHVEVSRLPGVAPRPAALVTLRPADALPLVVSPAGDVVDQGSALILECRQAGLDDVADAHDADEFVSVDDG